MATVYYEEHGDLSVLDDRTVAVIGFGNQGRAQAMNLRDSGLEVIVGNRGDEAGARISRSIIYLGERMDQVPMIVIPCYDVEAGAERYGRLIGPERRRLERDANARRRNKR